VASDLSLVQSHHQDRSSRRPPPAATSQPTPFAALLDGTDNAPPPSPPDRAERPQPDQAPAPASTRDIQPDTGARRGQGSGQGSDQGNSENRADSTDTRQPTAAGDSKTAGDAGANVTDADAKVAEAKAAEAKAAEGKAADAVVGKDDKPAKSDGTDATDAAVAVAVAVATDASTVQQPAAGAQVAVPVPAIPSPDAPAAKTDADAAEAAAKSGATIAPAAAAAAAAAGGAVGAADAAADAADQAQGPTKSGDASGKAGRKAASGSTDTVLSTTPDATSTPTGKDLKASAPTPSPTPAAAAAAAAATNDGPGEHGDQTGANPADKGEPARPKGNRPAGETAAAKPGEASSRPQVEAQAAADKPPTDAGQLPPQQHRVESTLAPAAAAPAAAAAATDSVAVPVAGLAVEIAARVQAGSNRFSIRLDPPELGRVDVRLDVDRDGNVTSRLTVDKVETLDLLRRDAPQLERALQQAGLKTGDSGGMQFTLRDQSFGGQNQNLADNPRSGAARIVVPDPEMTPVDTAASGYGRSLRLGTGIDIRV
jgi:chemotaxis protein MotD